MARNLIIRSRRDEPIYTRSVAAELARISEEFLRACEQERLIRTRVMTGGGQGYSAADVRRLARIRRLREDLELDLPAVEVVLHMRRRVLDLLQEMDEMERYMRQREQELLAEIQQLRRHLAEEADWRQP